jgi:phage gpG-like protein
MKPKQFIKRLQGLQEVKKKAPLVLAQICKGHFEMSFRNQGFTDRSLNKWKQRKGNKDPQRAILVKSSRLKRSIFIKSASFSKIVIASRSPYAEYHNEGTDILPQRKFMGNSHVLKKKLEKKLESMIKEALTK